MSRNGSGVYTLNTAGQPVGAGTVITATAFNSATADIATALTQSICVDGQSVITGNIPFATFKATGLGVATTSGDALSYGQAANVTTLTATAITATSIAFGGSTLSSYVASTAWTPSLGGTTTYNSQSGRYARIGNIIVARFFLDINAIGSGSATTISGLPVASNATLDGAGSPPLYFATLATSVTSLTAYVAAGSSSISFSCLTAAAGTVTLAPSLFQNSSQIKGQVIYEA